MAGDATVSGVSDSSPLSLTQDEARARAALLEVERYDIERRPARHARRASDWAGDLDDHVPLPRAGRGDVRRLRRRGPARRRSTASTSTSRRVDGGRLPLPGLAERQRAGRLVGAARHRPRARRSCAASTRRDKLVYVWTSVRARRRPAGLGLLRPARPQGAAPRSRSARRRRGRSPATRAPDVGRPTATTAAGSGSFPDTPAAVDVRRGGQRRPVPRDPRGARRPQPRPLLPAVAAAATSSATPSELFRLTEQGLAFFGERFGVAVPAGALRPGLRARPRRARWRTGAASPGATASCAATPPTHGERRVRRHGAAARDGAHVVRRPGDHALVGRPVAQRGVRVVGGHLGGGVSATDYTDAGATILADAGARAATARTWARPATRSAPRCPTWPHAFANFDAITYDKGQAVLRQLVAYVGEERFVEGLRAYFRDHAWGNTTLDDLMRADRRGGGPGPRRLAGRRGWTGPAPTRIVLLPTRRADGVAGCWRPARTAASRDAHRLRIGSYRVRGGDPAARRRAGRRPPTSRPPAPRTAGRPPDGRPAPAQRRRPDLRRGPHRRGVAARRC